MSCTVRVTLLLLASTRLGLPCWADSHGTSHAASAELAEARSQQRLLASHLQSVPGLADWGLAQQGRRLQQDDGVRSSGEVRAGKAHKKKTGPSKALADSVSQDSKDKLPTATVKVERVSADSVDTDKRDVKAGSEEADKVLPARLLAALAWCSAAQRSQPCWVHCMEALLPCGEEQLSMLHSCSQSTCRLLKVKHGRSGLQPDCRVLLAGPEHSKAAGGVCPAQQSHQ